MQRREAALRVRSAARGGAAAARGVALGGALSEPAGPSALFVSQSRTRGRVPHARGARAKLLEGKLAARRRESEAEFETLACGSGRHLFRKT